MTFEDLEALGAEIVSGSVSYKGKFIGTPLKSGEVALTPDGEELMRALAAESKSAPKAEKPASAKKVAKKVEPEIPAEPKLDDLGAAFGGE